MSFTPAIVFFSVHSDANTFELALLALCIFFGGCVEVSIILGLLQTCFPLLFISLVNLSTCSAFSVRVNMLIKFLYIFLEGGIPIRCISRNRLLARNVNSLNYSELPFLVLSKLVSISIIASKVCRFAPRLFLIILNIEFAFSGILALVYSLIMVS